MREIHDEATLVEVLAGATSLGDVVLFGLDLRPYAATLRGLDLRDAVILGCHLEPADLAHAVERGALVFPRLADDLPFEPWRAQLYTVSELFDAFERRDPCTYCHCLDARIYRHFRATGGADEPALLEALARRLHDHGVSEALESLLSAHPKVVAFMGGHGMHRDDASYASVARLAASLASRGFLVATGGGPGAMEAANLGTRFADVQDQLDEALGLLRVAPSYRDEGWLAAAFEVRECFPQVFASEARVSLGVPTFFYGHEPPNAFATHHAKYFANCTREEGLVSLASHGIVFAPGSAGTVQEIFQDACQNHYGTVRGQVSPMALFGVRYWSETLPALPLLRALATQGGWNDRILVSDDPAEIIAFIETQGPRVAKRTDWSFCSAFCEQSP